MEWLKIVSQFCHLQCHGEFTIELWMTMSCELHVRIRFRGWSNFTMSCIPVPRMPCCTLKSLGAVLMHLLIRILMQKVASGLIPNWNQHAKSTQKAAEGRAIGGLSDSDMFSKKPKFKTSKSSSAQRDAIQFDGTHDFLCENKVHFSSVKCWVRKELARESNGSPSEGTEGTCLQLIRRCALC